MIREGLSKNRKTIISSNNFLLVPSFYSKKTKKIMANWYNLQFTFQKNSAAQTFSDEC